MKFNTTPVQGAIRIELEPRSDIRGVFARVFCEKEFRAAGIDTVFVQSNISVCTNRGTIRGLHWQADPHGEAKLFRCTRGEIFQAIVDMRPDSPTYRQWYGTILNEQDRNMLYVPPGCANGYQALTDQAEVTYHVGEYYHPESERGLRWNDPAFRIAWPITDNVIVSEKDQSWPNV